MVGAAADMMGKRMLDIEYLGDGGSVRMQLSGYESIC
jgi:hypothetical protein